MSNFPLEILKAGPMSIAQALGIFKAGLLISILAVVFVTNKQRRERC